MQNFQETRGSPVDDFARPVSVEESTLILQSRYGLTGEIKKLDGERDQNFKLTVSPKQVYLFKLIHPSEDPLVTDFHVQILSQLSQKDPSIPVQKIVQLPDDTLQASCEMTDGSVRIARLSGYIPGTPSSGVTENLERNFNLGVIIGKCRIALYGFSHSGDRHDLIWDIKHVPDQAKVIDLIEDPDRRALFRQAINRFETKVSPEYDLLEQQVIHNDLNPDNIIVDTSDKGKILGIIDFGDSVRAPAINDLAVAMSYHFGDDNRTTPMSQAVLAGYETIVSIDPLEKKLLQELIIARLIIRIGITEQRARRFSENKDYILRNTQSAWTLLEFLMAFSGDLFVY